MSKGAITFNQNNVEYYTPKNIIEMFGPFDYDPATTSDIATYFNIPNYDTKETNGLLSDWSTYKNIWINPPFNLKFEFLGKAVQTYQQSKNDIYFLSPASILTTKKYHQIIQDVGTCLYVPSGRINFFNPALHLVNSPAFGCIIIKLQQTHELKYFHLSS